jgi:predicted nucleotidyltransferase
MLRAVIREGRGTPTRVNVRHNWGSMTVAQIQIPETEIIDLCRRNGIRKLALFGSVLTNRFSDASDVDVLVEFRPQERVGFFRLADVEAELSRLLGGRKVDLRTPMDLSRHFRDEVVQGALVLYAEP